MYTQNVRCRSEAYENSISRISLPEIIYDRHFFQWEVTKSYLVIEPVNCNFFKRVSSNKFTPLVQVSNDTSDIDLLEL